MSPTLDPDDALRDAAPAVWEALSPLGRRLRMTPSFLPRQTAEARGKRFNATIGQITDGHGRAVPLPTVEAALAGLPDEARSRALLYSPVEGLMDLRTRWCARQRRGQPPERPSSLPLVTGGVVHALSLTAQLFAGEGRFILLQMQPPAGYAETFGHTGAKLVPIAGLRHPDLEASPLAGAFRSMRDGTPALVVLRLPMAPEEPPLSPSERASLAQILTIGAARRPVVVMVDDLWERFESIDGRATSASLFWDLVDRHPSLVPLKVDGAEGELGYPGGRIGFLTLPFPPDSDAARELENRFKLLLRAEIGSPSAASQMVLLAGLGDSP